jgi:hypothetical protein
MSPPPGRVVRGVRRAFLASGGRELTTRDLWEWTHPRETQCRDRFRRLNICRAIRKAADKLAVRVGRVWPSKSPHSAPGGIVWRLRNTEET